MKIFKYLIDNYVNPVIVVILTTIIVALVSRVSSGKWEEWFILIPLIIWKIFVVLIILWIIIIFIFKRAKYLKDSDGPFFHSSYAAPYGWISLMNFNYNDVIWRIRSPKSDPYGSFSKSFIEVETPPRCPNCETELEQSHSFWGGYIWKCVMCNFKKRNRESFYVEGKRAEKIAKRNLELQDNNT